MANRIEAEGVIHGKTIELADDPGLEDGQRVRVQVMAKASAHQTYCNDRTCVR